jgi:hypothetical protein
MEELLANSRIAHEDEMQFVRCGCLMVGIIVIRLM